MKPEEQLQVAHETNRRLNQRCQVAEAALIDWRRVSELPFSRGSFGRKLLAWAATKAKEENDKLSAENARLRAELQAIARYVAVEGRPDGESLRVGLAYDCSIWGPHTDPEYGAMELAEAVERWLKERVEKALKGGV